MKYWGETESKKVTTAILKAVKKYTVTEAETVVWHGEEALTRFANSMIHQSVNLEDVLIHVRLVVGKKIGVARTNRIDAKGIMEVVKNAYDLAMLQQDDPDFISLPQKASYESVDVHYEKELHVGPKGRAAAIAYIVSQTEKAQLVASGAFSESASEMAIANSHGVFAYSQGKAANLTAIVTGEKGSGFGSDSAKGGEMIDYKAVGQLAVDKATHGELMDVPPGDYEVILEPAAVAELMDFFSWYGPNARMFHEGSSFYEGNIGKQVLHEALTIYDDPYHPAGYPVAFDFEGHPKKRYTLVEKGVFKEVMYDSYHANKFKKENTGHALLAPNTYGPIPINVVIEAGDTTVPAMIKNIKKGLLVTRFWYTRVVEHRQLILTGMTRDGTFYIEDGKIKGRVRNLRYTESVLRALKDIKGIGKELSLQGSEGSPSLVPALHVGAFRFTGVTQHG